MSPKTQALCGNTRWIPPRQGAATSVLLAASPPVQGVTGRYVEARNEAELTCDGQARTGVRAHALDPHDAARLWQVSSALIKAAS